MEFTDSGIRMDNSVLNVFGLMVNNVDLNKPCMIMGSLGWK